MDRIASQNFFLAAASFTSSHPAAHASINHHTVGRSLSHLVFLSFCFSFHLSTTHQKIKKTISNRREYDERMKRCKEREAELASKQEVIRVNVVRFERFIKDNDVKRQRALKKERDETAERLKLQEEVEALEITERQTRMTLLELMETLRRLTRYEEYLDNVVEESEFSEIPEVLFKFGTMSGTNMDLRRFLEEGNGTIEQQRARLVTYSKSKEEQVMSGGSEASQLKKTLEALRVENTKAEDVVEQAAKAETEKVKEQGASIMAIANLFKRCKDVTRGTPRFTLSEMDLVLEFIQNKVTDLAFAVEVHQKGPEEAGLRMDTFDKNKIVKLPGVRAQQQRKKTTAGAGAGEAGAAAAGGASGGADGASGSGGVVVEDTATPREAVTGRGTSLVVGDGHSSAAAGAHSRPKSSEEMLETFG